MYARLSEPGFTNASYVLRAFSNMLVIILYPDDIHSRPSKNLVADHCALSGVLLFCDLSRIYC